LRKSRFCILATDRQTNGQTDGQTDALSRSPYRDRRLNKSQRATRTDGQTFCDDIVRAMHMRRAVLLSGPNFRFIGRYFHKSEPTNTPVAYLRTL